MENFIFYNPTKIIFGKDTENKLPEEVKRYGSRVLLHYGGETIKKIGLYDKIIKLLKKENIAIVELPGVKPNPRISLVREGIEICRKENIDLVLAVGGGSVIDSAKAICFGVPYDGDVWDFFTGKATVKKAISSGVILTISAAGSESSSGTVITNKDSHYKRGVETTLMLPKFAILNPELTYTLSSRQTAIGVTDIISHIWERYFTSVDNVDLTDRLCEATMKTVIRNAYVAMEEPDNYNARAEIMWAGCVGHNGLLGTGRIEDWGSHQIGHEISGIFDTAHGETLSVIFPAWMKYVYKKFPKRFAQYAVRVWNLDAYFDSIEKLAFEGIKKTEGFLKSIGMPLRLSEIKVSSDRFDEIASNTTSGRDYVGNLIKLYRKDILDILNLAK